MTPINSKVLFRVRCSNDTFHNIPKLIALILVFPRNSNWLLMENKNKEFIKWKTQKMSSRNEKLMKNKTPKSWNEKKKWINLFFTKPSTKLLTFVSWIAIKHANRRFMPIHSESLIFLIIKSNMVQG